jgi:hypothetical protein
VLNTLTCDKPGVCGYAVIDREGSTLDVDPRWAGITASALGVRASLAVRAVSTLGVASMTGSLPHPIRKGKRRRIRYRIACMVR